METFQVSVASVPEVISTRNRHLHKKKSTKGYMCLPRLLNLFHKTLTKLEDRYK